MNRTDKSERWWDRDLPWYIIGLGIIYLTWRIVIAIMKGTL